MKQLFKYSLILVPPLLLGVAWAHNVPKAVTEEDSYFIRAILNEHGKAGLIGRVPASFEDEINSIVAVQDAVLAHAPEDKGMPKGYSREPRSLYKIRYGCGAHHAPGHQHPDTGQVPDNTGHASGI